MLAIDTADPVFIDGTAVARLLGLRDATQLNRIRTRLEDEQGFPVPVPHWRRPLKWRRDQVVGWIAAQGRPRASVHVTPVAIAANLLREARSA